MTCTILHSPFSVADEKVYHCHLCNSPFATRGTLKVHMRLHTGAKPFKCSQCPLTFRTSGHRKNHMLGHMKTVSDRRSNRKAATAASKAAAAADRLKLNDIPPQVCCDWNSLDFYYYITL